MKLFYVLFFLFGASFLLLLLFQNLLDLLGFLLVGLLGFLLLDAQNDWLVLLIGFVGSIQILYFQKKKETCDLCLAFQCSQMICQNLECKAQMLWSKKL